MAQENDKIDVRNALAFAALAMSAITMFQQWSGAADKRVKEHADRICRLEAIAGVGECKR